MTLDDDRQEMIRLSRLIDSGVTELREASSRLAQAEFDYRKGKAIAWSDCPDGIADFRRAWVDAETAELRQARDEAEGDRATAIEALRARRQQLSAYQSFMAATRAEAELARTGPH